jgi:adenylosuccinate synthase
VILPTHRLLDAAYEKSKGELKIGSTLKGIGPTYQDKIARVGLRIGDVLANSFKTKYESLKAKHIEILNYYKHDFDLTDYENQFFESIEFLKSFKLVDSEYVINDELESSSVLAEGAQGSLLDVDFGSYPFVTSSNTMTAGACTGLGIAPNKIGEVFGVFKAYCTRVGSGPFPTELKDEIGQLMQKEGNEFGATTGRPRRCGWLDLPALKYTIMINGVTQLFMMKADVLNIFKEIKVCTRYKLIDGSIIDKVPYEIVDIEIEPVYKSFPGWNCTLEGISDYDEFPIELSEYVTYLEKELKTPINIVPVGPDRMETIIRGNTVIA